MRPFQILAFIAFIAFAGYVYVQIAGGTGNGTNINAREAYWQEQITASLPPDATKAQLEAFAAAHGHALHCFQDYQRADRCRIVDLDSHGGTANLPMRLSVDFPMQGDRIASHEFGTVSANAEE